MRTGYQFLPAGDSNMTEFKKLKESMMEKIRTVHLKFHSATSSAPEIDRLVAETR